MVKINISISCLHSKVKHITACLTDNDESSQIDGKEIKHSDITI